MEAVLNAMLVGVGLVAIGLAAKASRDSWRDGHRGYALFAGLVATIGFAIVGLVAAGVH